MSNRPYSANELRLDLQVAIARMSVSRSGNCTKHQASMIARYMGAIFNMRFIRLAVTEWLLKRLIASSNDLTFAEAHVLLKWLSGYPGYVRQEAAAALVATFMTVERERVR